jgi:hypothetical protein
MAVLAANVISPLTVNVPVSVPLPATLLLPLPPPPPQAMRRKPTNANKTAWAAKVVHDRGKAEDCMGYPFLSDVGNADVNQDNVKNNFRISPRQVLFSVCRHCAC